VDKIQVSIMLLVNQVFFISSMNRHFYTTVCLILQLIFKLANTRKTASRVLFPALCSPVREETWAYRDKYKGGP